MPRVEANGIRLHYQQIGQGDRVVVFLHGLLLDNLSSWYYTLGNPVARTSRSLMYDLRGHGLSDQPASGYRVEDHVADLAALLDAIGIDRPVYLAANSYGGYVALEFARTFPSRVAGLIMIEGHFPVDDWADEVAETLEFAGIWMETPAVIEWRQKHEKRRSRRRLDSAQKLLQASSLLDDLRAVKPYGEKELAEIRCPMLAVYGDGSDVIERGRDLGRWVPGCDLRVLEHCAHAVLMERTHEVRDHVIGWLDEQSPRES